MSSRQTSIDSLTAITEKLSDKDVRELQGYAYYLFAKHCKQESHIHVNELLMQHDENTKLLVTYILQRSRLISMVNQMAHIILRNQTSSETDRCEAQESMKKANWILQGKTSLTEENS